MRGDTQYLKTAFVLDAILTEPAKPQYIGSSKFNADRCSRVQTIPQRNYVELFVAIDKERNRIDATAINPMLNAAPIALIFKNHIANVPSSTTPIS